FNKEYQQALLAVQETAGKVLTFENQIARTYYTASNGGQTEASSNAWTYEPTPYLGVWDDHYDEQNPQSVVRTFSIPRIWDADTPEKTNFENLLKGLVAEQIVPIGYDTEPSYIEIEEFKNISAITPKFQNGSRLMTQLEITLSVSARRKIQPEQEKEISLFTVEAITPWPAFTSPPEQAWGLVETIPKPIKLIVDISPQIEELLSLSINLKENEIIQVVPGDNAFIIRSSRYGHGVGMSQRGAEWMAKKYDKSYSEILDFYYPGTLQETYQTIPESRPSLGLEYLTTPGPVPTATPRPTHVPQSAAAGPGQWKVIITEISPNSSLNLRILPSITSDVISQLYYGQYSLVLERVGEHWLHVQADGIQGYVMESFVQRLP
ncbi:MAG: SpoIID/LytB domain-containing protein, partial [Clostridiales bacterium]|nr:SpoIID/LytB domain-containing protein [Clostridiales bacterium]